MIRKFVAAMSLCLVACFAGAGCSPARTVNNFYPQARWETFGQEAKDHRHSLIQITAQDRMSLTEDLDLIFMTDRSSRLSRWHSK